MPWPSSSAISKINNASKWENSSLLVARKQISTATSGSTRSMIGDVSKIYRTYVYIYTRGQKERQREGEDGICGKAEIAFNIEDRGRAGQKVSLETLNTLDSYYNSAKREIALLLLLSLSLSSLGTLHCGTPYCDGSPCGSLAFVDGSSLSLLLPTPFVTPALYASYRTWPSYNSPTSNYKRVSIPRPPR